MIVYVSKNNFSLHLK